MKVELWWNNNDRGKSDYSKKSQVSPCASSGTRTDLWSKMCLR